MAHSLVVDDDPVLLDLLSKILRHAGHQVEQAEHGMACLALVNQTHFDLIITDVMMPEMDGYELTQRLRAHPNARTSLIIIQTSSLSGPDKTLSEAVGADAHILKTVNLFRVSQVVAQILAQRSETSGRLE